MMIGIDIIEISRFEKNIDNKAFLDKLFTQSEQAYISKKGNRPQTAAGLFAAKEAVLKAAGTGLSEGALAVEIFHDEKGKPYARYKGDIVNISISHCRDYAAANAILEEKE